jgi:outer membrane protein assembly factor BamB
MTLLVVAVLAETAGAADPQPAWPQANGPFGNFTPRTFNVELIDDAADAKQLWLSEDDDLGYAKGSVSGYLSNLARWDGHPGSSSGPIAAEGMIFVTSFRPSGKPWAENLPQLKRQGTPKKPFTEEQKARMRRNLRILADDLLVAIDQATGKTVWKAVEEGKGLNRYMGKRQGFCVSPAYYDGAIFSMGTTGLLYAYDAATGKELWETNIGAAHEKALAHKANVLEKKQLAGGMGWDSSLTVADGVLIVPLFEGRADLGLRGVSVKTGATVWEAAEVCSRHATPAVWSHESRQYVLVATVAGELRLIDPRDGKVLWTVEGLGENHFSLSPSAKYALVNGGSKMLRKEGSTQKYGLLAAYRLSPEKAELAWKHPDTKELYFSTWMDSCARRFLAVADGRVFYRAHGTDRSESQLLVLDEQTGKVLARLPNNSPAPHFYPLEDRLLLIRDASHSETELAMIRANANHLKQLAEFWHPPHQNTTAYEVSMEHPYADGRIYLRTKDGRVACYDLRKQAKRK